MQSIFRISRSGEEESFYRNEELLHRSERSLILAVTFGPELILDTTGSFDSLKLSVLVYY